jgi:hypothetical protein
VQEQSAAIEVLACRRGFYLEDRELAGVTRHGAFLGQIPPTGESTPGDTPRLSGFNWMPLDGMAQKKPAI